MPRVGVPQRGHLSSESGAPQLEQNAAPGTVATWQLGQVGAACPERDTPQVEHRVALASTSAPQLGQGLYASPQ